MEWTTVALSTIGAASALGGVTIGALLQRRQRLREAQLEAFAEYGAAVLAFAGEQVIARQLRRIADEQLKRSPLPHDYEELVDGIRERMVEQLSGVDHLESTAARVRLLGPKRMMVEVDRVTTLAKRCSNSDGSEVEPEEVRRALNVLLERAGDAIRSWSGR